MQVIATRTDANWGLIDEAEFVSVDETLKGIFLEFGWVKPHDPSDPLPPKGLNNYVEGEVYPPDRFIIYNGSMYQSNTTTLATWVPGEWDLKIGGA